MSSVIFKIISSIQFKNIRGTVFDILYVIVAIESTSKAKPEEGAAKPQDTLSDSQADDKKVSAEETQESGTGSKNPSIKIQKNYVSQTPPMSP